MSVSSPAMFGAWDVREKGFAAARRSVRRTRGCGHALSGFASRQTQQGFDQAL
jgi:hypothetical protein